MDFIFLEENGFYFLGRRRRKRGTFEEINFNDSESLKSLSLSKNDFEVFDSWGDISEVNNFELMPQSLKLYIQFIEEYLQIPIKIISLGPERSQTIIR